MADGLGCWLGHAASRGRNSNTLSTSRPIVVNSHGAQWSCGLLRDRTQPHVEHLRSAGKMPGFLSGIGSWIINVVSVKGPESCRGRLGLREELPRLRQLDGERGKWWRGRNDPRSKVHPRYGGTKAA